MVTSPKPSARVWPCVLALSLAANGWMAVRLSSESDSGGRTAAQIDRSKTKESKNRTKAKRSSDSRPPKRANALTWNALSSPDYETFAKNLRAAGCPEELIADLLAPEINRKFNRATTASYLAMVGKKLPWTPSPDWENWSLGTDFSEIEDQYNKLISAIFGEQYAGERGWRKWPFWDDRFRVREEKLSFLEANMRKQADTQEAKRYDLKRKLRRSKPRPTDEEIEAQVLQRRLAHIETLKTNHSPDQVAEYVLRSSLYAAIPRSIPGMEFTVNEMKEITRHFEEGRIANDAEFAGTFGKVRELLGDARFRTFEPAARKELEEIARRQKY